MTFDEILENQRPDQDNYDNAVAMSERFKKATESPDWNENPYFNLEDASRASRNPVNRVYNTDDLKNITSDVGTIAWDSFRKGVMDLQSVGDKADMALGNTLAGISGNTLGTEMRDRAADSLMKTMEESRFIDSNYGDAETWTSRFVGGGMSMAEMLAVGAATGAVGLGAYVGTLSLSDGALNDMVKYQEEHGNLEGYETNPVNLALDYANAVFQIATEEVGGAGRLLNGKVLKAGKTSSAIIRETMLNFLQESAQGAASDVTEILKGNKDINILAENALGYVKDGVVAGVLGGAIGGSAYKLNKNRALQNLDKINTALNPNATQEEIRQKSEEVFAKTEEKALKTFVPELIAQNEAINDKGSIRDNVQKKVAAMYDEAEDMSEQQKAKAIEATTTLELENMLYDSIERKIPLTANPLLQGEVNELGWFREGIPENRRDEIESLRQEYVSLRDELRTQNESEQKNYEKIEELENKIELFRKELPNKLQDLVVADRAELRKMLEEQRERVATSQARKRMISGIRKKAQSAIKAQETAENKLAEQMARGAEKAQIQRETKETAQQTKEAKIRDLQEQRDIARAIKNVKLDIATKKTARETITELDYTEDTGYNALKQQGYTDEQISKMPADEIAKAVETQENIPGVKLPTETGKSVTFEYHNQNYKVTRTQNGYVLEVGIDGEYFSAIEVKDDGVVEYTNTLTEEQHRGWAIEAVQMAEHLFGDLTITISKGNTNAENLWFGLGYTKEIADRTFVKEDESPFEDENFVFEGSEYDLSNVDINKINERKIADYISKKGKNLTKEKGDWAGKTNIELLDSYIKPQSDKILEKAKKIADKNGYVFDKELNEKHQEVQDWLEDVNTDSFINAIFGKYDVNQTLLDWLNDNPKVKYLDDVKEEKSRAWYTLDKDGLIVGDWRVGQVFLKSEKAQDMSEYKNDYDEGNIEIYVYKVPATQEELIDNLFNYYVERYNEDLEVNENLEGAPLETTDVYSQKPEQTLLLQSKTTGSKDTYRGAYLPEYRFIAKTANMDASTLNHELAHDWGQEYFRWARSGRASESFLRSWGAVEKAIGITDKDTYFTYDASEKFARAYEGWLLQKKDWAKILKIDNDDDKKAVESMMEDYRQELVDIYESLLESSKYFKDTYGEVGELKPELVNFFERAVNYNDIDVRAKRGEITQERAAEEKLNKMLENSVDASVESMPVAQVQDADAIMQIQDLQQTANDTEKFEVEGGNKKALQKRLDNIALAQDLTQNDKDLGKYDSHRDMLAVAEQADEFVKTRREDALAIINGEMAEQDGLYASDLYTALEREANATGDFELIQELRNSKIANEMAKELGQRVAGFRNYKGSGDIDVVSVLNSLDKKLKDSYNKNKDKADEYIGDLVAELKVADNNAKLDEFFDEMECR